MAEASAVCLSGVRAGVCKWYTRPHFAGDLLVQPEAVTHMRLGSISPLRSPHASHLMERIAVEKPMSPPSSRRARGGGDYVRSVASASDRASRRRGPSSSSSMAQRVRHSPAFTKRARQHIALASTAPLIIGGAKHPTRHPPSSTFGGGKQKTFAIVSQKLAAQITGATLHGRPASSGRRIMMRAPEYGFGGIGRPPSRSRSAARKERPSSSHLERTSHSPTRVLLDLAALSSAEEKETAMMQRWWAPEVDAAMYKPRRVVLKKPAIALASGMEWMGGLPQLQTVGKASPRGGAGRSAEELRRERRRALVEEKIRNRRDRRMQRGLLGLVAVPRTAAATAEAEASARRVRRERRKQGEPASPRRDEPSVPVFIRPTTPMEVLSSTMISIEESGLAGWEPG